MGSLALTWATCTIEHKKKKKIKCIISWGEGLLRCLKVNIDGGACAAQSYMEAVDKSSVSNRDLSPLPRAI